MPLEYPDHPERYQLFELDEDGSDLEIEYDMGPRNFDEAVGEFPQLAFVENKRNKRNAFEEATRESKEMAAALEADDKRLINVFCNTVLINSANYALPMANTDKISTVF